jgi:spectinomycin phosphotransferase
MTQRQWNSFGNLLAQVHAAPLPVTLDDHLPEEDFSHATLPSVTQAVDRGLRSDVISADETVQALAKEWRAGLADRIHVLLAAADDLGCRLRAESPRHVLCHGDPHVGNVLLVDGTPWLLDWDDAMLAPKERDLVLLKGGMGGYGPANPTEQAWFDDGYGSAAVDPVLLTYYRCTRAVEDVVDFAHQILDVDRRPGGARRAPGENSRRRGPAGPRSPRDVVPFARWDGHPCR